MSTFNGWTQQNNDWWFSDFSKIAEPDKLNTRPLPGFWQAAPYRTAQFAGTMILANPSQNAPEIRIPLPVAGRYAVTIGLFVNYCDRVLLKLSRDKCFVHMRHSPVPAEKSDIEECWWRDIDLVEGDVLVLKQDNAMKRRCAIAFVKLSPALPPTPIETRLLITADGLPGNDGPIDLVEMMAAELQFADTNVTDILHGTDISGQAQYMTKLPSHRYWTDRVAEETQPDNEYYIWTWQQLKKYEREGRCPLRDSIAATHGIGRKFYSYYRMAISRLYAPFRSLFENPMFDAHPEWRCVDFDGTPVSRLSIAFPEVRQYMLEHFRETIEFGADGLCLVFNRGWPLVLFEKPVADEFKKRTGKEMRSVSPDDPALRQVRADMITSFLREIRQTMIDAAKGRPTEIVALVLAQPGINRHFGMDCDTWAREGLVEVLCPYPYGMTATPAQIHVPEWVEVVRGTKTQLCPTINRMTYEPSGIFETPLGLIDRAEQWLKEGVHGFMVWDMDSAFSLPTFRGIGYYIGSKEGRARFRSIAERGPIVHELKEFDGLTVDRYHPGWNV